MSFKLKNAPRKPGVYIYKNSEEEIIYIGKANNLFKRTNSYFQKEHDDPKTRKLVKKIATVDFLVTDNEVEALILELNLIKKHRPIYNIDYKDDKSYPYIAITLQDEFPRVFVTRDSHKKGIKYFGPYVNATALRHTIDTLRSIFELRTCKGSKPGRKGQKPPCLNFHIEKCLAPCTGKVASSDYKKIIETVIDFLEGRGNSIMRSLEAQMKKAAASRQFEKAARIRDRIEGAKAILHKQKVASEAGEDIDIFGTFENDGYFAVALFMIRGGKLIGSENFEFKEGAETEPLLSFIKHYYHTTSFVPKEVLVGEDLSDKSTLEAWLKELRGASVTVKKPKRGQKKRLLELASKNASHNLDFYLKRLQVESEKSMKALKQLKENLGIEMPYRIECFDISNISGQEAVGSMVVFESGKPLKSHYRKFKVHFDEGINDYKMMAEVVGRRLKGLSKIGEDNSFNTKPNLILIDGGKGQLSAAKGVLDYYYSDINIASLAKREEELFIPGKKEPIMLDKDSEALKLVQQIRDEAHRFAITYHRLLRSKKMFK